MNVQTQIAPAGSLVAILFIELIRAVHKTPHIKFNEPYTVQLGDLDVDVAFQLDGSALITYLTTKT